MLGLIWIAGRAMHFTGYNKAVKKRLPGFFLQSTACRLLFIGALAGIVMHGTSGLERQHAAAASGIYNDSSVSNAKRASSASPASSG